VSKEEDSEDHTLAGFMELQSSPSSKEAGEFTFVSSVMQGASFCETHRGHLSLCKDLARGYNDIVGVPLATMLKQDQVYFPDGHLHLKMDLWCLEEDSDDESSSRPSDDEEEV